VGALAQQHQTAIPGLTTLLAISPAMKRISAYLKMRVLGAIDFAEGASIQQRVKTVSRMTFHDEDHVPHQFTWRTIQTWLTRYKKHGLTELKSRRRSDTGKPRKVSPEQLLEAIETVKPLFREKSLLPRLVYRACVEKGLLRPEEVSQTSFYRITKEFDLLVGEGQTDRKKRLAFAKAHANDMWQADTLCGPMVKIKGSIVMARLIAFIDDASRVVAHGQFFAAETVDTLIQSFRTALYKRGIPQQLYVDNGSVYASKEISLICSRLGILLSHTPVRDGAAKGKIERFFRTVRECFLSRQLDLSSLDALNRQFIEWLEHDYNGHAHSSLGMKPIDRFGLDLKRIRFLPPDPANDELFFREEDRRVSKTNTFQLHRILFEAPVDLRGKTIQVRFDRLNFDHFHVVVYFKNERLGLATPLDLVANDRPPRSTASYFAE
jgi:transposase InsO family protein